MMKAVANQYRDKLKAQVVRGADATLNTVMRMFETNLYKSSI